MKSNSLFLSSRSSARLTGFSILVAALAAAASLAGLIFPSQVYPSAELRRSLVANDLITLVIGLPCLLGAMALARRGHLAGFIYWPGALFFLVYNYLVYTIAMPLTLPFVIYLGLVLLSLYTIYGLLTSLDARVVSQRLLGRVPARFCGGVLIAFGVLFFFWRGVLLLQNLTGQIQTPLPELATMGADVIISPAWVTGGVLLWRRREFGYLSGGGLLFQFSMLFIGLLAFFALQPLLFGAPFPINDFVAVFSMTLVCLIPFVLFTRGILSTRAE